LLNGFASSVECKVLKTGGIALSCSPHDPQSLQGLALYTCSITEWSTKLGSDCWCDNGMCHNWALPTTTQSPRNVTTSWRLLLSLDSLASHSSHP
jgi:hypothetical protein